MCEIPSNHIGLYQAGGKLHSTFTSEIVPADDKSVQKFISLSFLFVFLYNLCIAYVWGGGGSVYGFDNSLETDLTSSIDLQSRNISIYVSDHLYDIFKRLYYYPNIRSVIVKQRRWPIAIFRLGQLIINFFFF